MDLEFGSLREGKRDLLTGLCSLPDISSNGNCCSPSSDRTFPDSSRQSSVVDTSVDMSDRSITGSESTGRGGSESTGLGVQDLPLLKLSIDAEKELNSPFGKDPCVPAINLISTNTDKKLTETHSAPT